MIIVGCVGHERPWSSPYRSPHFRARNAYAALTREAREVVVSLLRPVIG